MVRRGIHGVGLTASRDVRVGSAERELVDGVGVTVNLLELGGEFLETGQGVVGSNSGQLDTHEAARIALNREVAVGNSLHVGRPPFRTQGCVGCRQKRRSHRRDTRHQLTITRCKGEYRRQSRRTAREYSQRRVDLAPCLGLFELPLTAVSRALLNASALIADSISELELNRRVWPVPFGRGRLICHCRTFHIYRMNSETRQTIRERRGGSPQTNSSGRLSSL